MRLIKLELVFERSQNPNDTRMRSRVDIRHPLLYIQCLRHSCARTVQLGKRALSRGVLGRIGVIFCSSQGVF